MFFWLLNQQEAPRCPSLPQTQHFDVEVDEVDFPFSFDNVVVRVAHDVLALSRGIVVAPNRTFSF